MTIPPFQPFPLLLPLTTLNFLSPNPRSDKEENLFFLVFVCRVRGGPSHEFPQLLVIDFIASPLSSLFFLPLTLSPLFFDPSLLDLKLIIRGHYGVLLSLVLRAPTLQTRALLLGVSPL